MKKLFMALFLMLYFSTPQICGAIDVTRHTVGGNVTGPVTGTDNAIARFDKSGKKIQNSGVTISDTNVMTVPAGLVATPSIVSDDADSGFYFGSKGFNWGVDGVNKFSLTSAGSLTVASNIVAGGYIGSGGAVITGVGGAFYSSANDVTALFQVRNFTAADNMVEMAYGTATFTGFDGEIAGVVIKPTVGIMNAGDTMTVNKCAPVSTANHTGGTLNCYAPGSITNDEHAVEIFMNLNETTPSWDTDLVRSNKAISCAAAVCTDVAGAYAVYLTSTGADVLTIANGVAAGQEKFISHKTDGGSVTVIPTNFSAGTSITMLAAGNTALLHWNGTKWDLVATYGGTVNP